MIYENVSTLQIHKLTQEQYDRELAAGRIDENAIYLTPDEEIDFSGYATEEYVDAATKDLKDELLGGAGEAIDTLKELADLINENQDAIDVLETIASGKADKEHTHELEEVNGLQDELGNIQTELESIQTTLSGKAEKEHGTHVEFSNEAPLMAGEAFSGVATTVARSDHRHATDTTRASKDDLENAVTRIQYVESKQESFLECGEEDILAMFA